MHMNIEITLRLMITPTTPIVNRTAESARYQESCGPSMSQSPQSFVFAWTSKTRSASAVVSVWMGAEPVLARGSRTSLANTWAPGTTRATGERVIVRRASVIAPTSAINNKIDVISNGKRYLVNRPMPIDAVRPMSDGPGGPSSETGTEYRTNANTPIRTAASAMATGARYPSRGRRGRTGCRDVAGSP